MPFKLSVTIGACADVGTPRFLRLRYVRARKQFGSEHTAAISATFWYHSFRTRGTATSPRHPRRTVSVPGIRVRHAMWWWAGLHVLIHLKRTASPLRLTRIVTRTRSTTVLNQNWGEGVSADTICGSDKTWSTAHAATAIRALFPDRVDSRFGDMHWPPRSADLSICDLFLRRYLKSRVVWRKAWKTAKKSNESL